jgi:membrane peptidoglycan carboxypeptidase
VANGGLNVTTTLDMRYQALAEQLATQHVEALRGNNLTNAALIAMKPNTGEILAMLGSVNYKDDAIDGQVNIVTSLQQPGSAFKPLTYALAMSPERIGERAWQPASVIWDVPVSYDQLVGEPYAPVNYDGRFHGPMRLREALANSYNLPAVQLAQDVGVSELVSFARQMGLESLSEDLSLYGLSLTLGGGEVRPLEMAIAYSVFANNGNKVPPVTILRVTNSRGDLLYEHAEPSAERILSPETAFLISDMLDDEAARQPAMGIDNPLALPFPAAAKTGTTNDFRDNWTVGYTPGLVTVVWTGNTDNSPMIDVSGLSGAAPLWGDFMEAVYADATLISELEVMDGLLPATEFATPTTLERAQYCNLLSVKADAETCELSVSEWRYKDGSVWITPEPSVRFEQLEEGVVRALSAPLPSPTSGEAYVPYCLMDEGKWPPQTAMRLFIAPPRDPKAIEPAQAWAQQNGLLILPNAICDTGAVAANPDSSGASAPVMWNTPTPNWAATQQAQQAAQPTWTPLPPQATATPLPPVAAQPTQPAAFQPPSNGLFYQISSPSVGQTVQGVVPIMGSADFDSATVQFYKIEVKRDGRDWVTLGEAHRTPVTNGQLETLNAAGLADLFGDGSYQLRLILVRYDGNYAGEPFTIPLTIRR